MTKIFLPKILLPLFILLLLNYYLYSWVRVIDTPERDTAFGIEQTTDGNYIIFGRLGGEEFNVPPENIFHLTKVDTEGNILWRQFFGGEYFSLGGDVKVAPDCGFIIGASRTAVYYSHIYIAKTDSEGNVEWEHVVDYDRHSTGLSVACAPDSGYVVTGETSIGRNWGEIYTVKVDKNGEQEWFKIYETPPHDWGNSISPTNDSCYIICGEINNCVGLVKVDSNGNELWRNIYGGYDWDRGYDAIQTTDDGYIAVGKTRSLSTVPNQYGAYLVKTDADGNEEWHSVFNGNCAAVGYAVLQTYDEGYIFAGNSGSPTAYIVKTDTNGNEEWSYYYGEGGSSRYIIDMCYTPDSCYMVCGSSSNNDSLNYNIVLIKIDNNGNVPVDDTMVPDEEECLLGCYPNPVSSNTTISFLFHYKERSCLPTDGENAHIEIYNIKGQLVKELGNITKFDNYNYSVDWDGKNENGKEVSNGVYFTILRLNGKIQKSKKITIIK